MDSWPATPNHLQVQAWSTKIDEKEKKKNLLLSPKYNSLTFHFGFSSRIGRHDETNLNS